MTQKEFLRLCAIGSESEILTAIQDEGADVNKRGYIYGAKVPPLFVAVMEENYGAIQILLDYGANEGDGFTAAVIKGKKKVIQFLVQFGADIDAEDSNGYNPLFLAVTSNNPRVVKWLVQFGANVNVKSEAGYTPLTYAALMQVKTPRFKEAQQVDPAIIEYLMKGKADYSEAMIIAVKSGNIPFLETIIKFGADLNKKCVFEVEQSPLAAAMFTGEEGINADMIKFLAENGADLNEIFVLGGNTYTNALNVSITADRPDIAEILLSNGADPNYRDPTGRTALVYAVVTSEEIVRLLLSYGADPNIADKNKRTPLMLAALDVGTEPGIMEALIEHGADINAQDEDGMTALLWVVGGKDRSPGLMMSSLIRTGGLRAEGWKLWFALVVTYAAVKREAQLDSIRLLVSHGADINITDNKGMNAMMCAVMGFDDEAAEILSGTENNKEE